LAYRLDLHGCRVAYCPWQQWDPAAASRRDHEWSKFVDFFGSADLLVHGAAPGCGPWEAAVDLVAEARVKRLVFLPGGEPGLAEQAQSRASAKPAALECLVLAAGGRVAL
jgi:hypothetical protein